MHIPKILLPSLFCFTAQMHAVCAQQVPGNWFGPIADATGALLELIEGAPEQADAGHDAATGNIGAVEDWTNDLARRLAS